MSFRSEELTDREAIFGVHAASFPTPAEARLVDALRDADNLTISLVAIEEGEVAGHVAFSPVTLLDSTAGIGLAPVAVLPAFRRRGVADQLIREGLSICEGMGFGFVVVLGDPAYYGRFGFVSASRWSLGDEYGGGDAFQALELRPNSIPPAGGLVRYAPEFSALDEASE